MQVERTLVKSAPELWAELSDVEALTRHLAQFGEIAITRVEPESKVAWEGEHASGTVQLTASGWGTKVTLEAEMAELPAEVAEVAPEPQPDAEPEPEPVAVDATPESAATTAAERAERRRWLRFWRRPAAEVPAPPAPEPDPTPPAPTPTPGPPPPPDPNPPQIEVEAILTRVLDDLGQAHHRPFSRS